MKRLHVFVVLILFCTLAYSQHPHSRGGNPLYWALVGGISAGILYVFYLLLGFLAQFIKTTKTKRFKSFKKNIYSILKKEDGEKTFECKTSKSILADKESQEINIKDDQHDIALCKQCGKQIQVGSSYCNYCGADQTRTPSILRRMLQKMKDTSYLNSLIKRFVRIILSLAFLALFGGIFAFICHEIGGHNDNLVICVFAPIAAYILYRLVHYAYKFNRKKKFLIIAILVLLVSALWGICITDSVSYEASRRAEAQRLEEMHRVNRTFLGCTMGDNASKVSKTLRKYVPNHLYPAMRLIGQNMA